MGGTRRRLGHGPLALRRARVLVRALGGGRRRSDPGQARVASLFLRALGAVAVLAFGSLALQVPVLLGSRGLLPARALLAAASSPDGLPDVAREGFLERPTLFWLDASDAALEGAAWAGCLSGVALALGLAPRACLLVLWALYLSFLSVGQSFLAFQWDNLLLETLVLALALAPPGLVPRRPWSPGPVGAFLVLWLAFRLHFESGLVKVLGGDPAWRDLTALQSYYETAPLPTALAWWVHHAPAWFHRASTALVLAVELAVPFLLMAPWRRARLAGFLVLAGLQLAIEATANYGYFSLLSIVVCLPALDDGHLAWVETRLLRRSPRTAPPPRRQPRSRTVGLLAAAAVLVPSSALPLLEVLRVPGAHVPDSLRPFRSINAYYLFTRMTLERREVVLEGSLDGETWEPYELCWKPGDVSRAPPFVAPHQPRVDFLCWFLLLGGHDDAFFQTLVRRVATEPDAVAPLFVRMPFAGASPRFLRVSTWRYRFSETGSRDWWTREPLGESNVIDASLFAPRSR